MYICIYIYLFIYLYKHFSKFSIGSLFVNFKIRFLALSARKFESKENWTCLLNEIDVLSEASFFEVKGNKLMLILETLECTSTEKFCHFFTDR